MFVEFVAHTHTHGAASEWVVVEFRHSLPQLKQQIFSSTDAHVAVSDGIVVPRSLLLLLLLLLLPGLSLGIQDQKKWM
jgi:hypothetical protein